MNTSRWAERKAAAKQARRRPLLSLLTRNFAINVHKSPSDETHVACGEIPSGSQAMPATGHPRGLSEEVFLPASRSSLAWSS
jgi:hypothetical protein